MKSLDVAIIGGGITGLALAHRLQEANTDSNAGLDFAVFEDKQTFGGVIETHRRDGFIIESGPDAFLSEKPHGLDLIRRLGLEGDIIPTHPKLRRSFVVRKGKLHPVPPGFYLVAPSRILPFAMSSLFSPLGKLRMGFDLVIPPKRDSEDESVSSFIGRRLGREALERVAEPMVSGIYSGDPARLSAQSVLPQFCHLEKEYGSLIRGLVRDSARRQGARGPRYSLFFTLCGGTEQIVQRILRKLPSESLKTKAHVMSLRFLREKRRWEIGFSDGSFVESSRVCLSIPAFEAARLVQDFSQELSEALRGVHYESVAVVHLAYRRGSVRHPLNGFGFVAPRLERLSLIGCSFSSVKFEGRAPAGHVLLRAFIGGAFGRAFLKMDGKDIVARVRKDLRSLLGVRGEPLFSELKRHPRTMPQYEVGHEAAAGKIERAREKWPGLHFAAGYLGGVGIPDRIHQGEEAADRIISENSRNAVSVGEDR